MVRTLGPVFIIYALLLNAIAEESHSVLSSTSSTILTGFVDTTILIPGSSLQILSPPQSTSVLRNGQASFSVVATADSPISYQWFHNGVLVEGATGDTLGLASAGDSDLGFYTVEASVGLAKYTSEPVELVYANLINLAIRHAVEVEAFLENGRFYQMQLSKDLDNWSNVGPVIQGTGATNLVLKSTSDGAGGYFRIKVTEQIPGGPGALAGKNFTFTTADGVFHFVEFSSSTNTFKLNDFANSRIAYDGTYLVAGDGYGRTLAQLQVNAPPAENALYYVLKFQNGANGSVDLLSVQRNVSLFSQSGSAQAVGELQAHTLELTVTNGAAQGEFKFDFSAAEYTGTHGSTSISGTYSYSREGAIGDLTIRHTSTTAFDSYFLIFTSANDIVLRGFQRGDDGSVTKVEGTGSMQ